ncbi:MAG: hypothetical protein MUE42_11130, partial [Opitutaceae bacterium]|nr:hypothetical protein [Opitutaceae bacterium]
GLDAWRRLPNSTDFFLTTPDGRAFVFIRPPSARDGLLSGLVRPLEPSSDGSPPAALHTLRIAHDGASRLRIDVRPLPAARQHAGEPSPEPASETPPTLP